MYELSVMQGMMEQQRFVFMQQMTAQRKDPTAGVLLALFLGGLGAHRFYMGQVALSLLYLVFFWTFIPAMVALVECLLMKDRIQRYNDARADEIANSIRYAFN